MAKRRITGSDLIPLEEYARQRRERRRQVIELKAARRMEVGPFATFYFECYETMWHQVHEMLFAERGGEDQIEGELDAYNPLIPQGNELVATLMLEIDEPVRRAQALAKLGGIEHSVIISFAGETVRAMAETDTERTRGDGKASTVQFVHFPFTRAQIAKFRETGTQVVVGFDHPQYRHMAIMPDAVKAAVVQDFD